MNRTIGIDEAGRGPILGPMAMAVVVLDRGAAISLRKVGVADSKSFGSGGAAREHRRALCDLIRSRAITCASHLVPVEEIDHYTYRGQLNGLERRVARDLLARVGACWDDRVICDGARLFGPLRGLFRRFDAVDRGESFHVSVAAASIVAKHERDEAFAQIALRYESEFGPIAGGGYVNAATRKFLDRYQQRYGTLPPEARRSWGAPKQINHSLFD